MFCESRVPSTLLFSDAVAAESRCRTQAVKVGQSMIHLTRARASYHVAYRGYSTCHAHKWFARMLSLREGV